MRKFALLLGLLAALPVTAQELFEAELLSASPVLQWHTAEAGVRIPAMDRRFRAFVAGGQNGVSPYNTANINLRAVFSNGTLRDTVQAFWYEAPVINRAANRYDTEPSNWPWRIRFAPPAKGVWTMQLLTAQPGEPAALIATNVSFTCTASNRHGWLTVAPNKRHLQFTDGTPFFAIGQNIAWAEEPILKGFKGPHPLYIGGFEDVYHYLNHLADCGGNFARIVLTPWCGGLENTTAGNYRQDHAAALDSMLHICEKRGIYAQVNFEFHHGYNVPWKYQWTWEKHPLRNAAGLSSYLQLLSNDSAIKLQHQLIRYFHARYGNSPNLAVYELMGEMDNWPAFEQNRPLFQSWITAQINFVRNNLRDNQHLLTVSFATPPYGSIYDIAGVQFVSLHHYTNDLKDNRRRYELVNGDGLFGEKRGTLRRYDKPSQFGEMGLINGPVNAADPDDYTWCSDISFHNSLWATSFMGCFGTGLNWWQWRNDSIRSANFPVLAAFIGKVPMHELTETGNNTANGLEVFWCSNEKGTRAAGWLHNTSYWWANMSQNCRDRNQKQMLPPKDDDAAQTPENRSGRSISINGLERNTLYSVTYFDTRVPGQTIKGIINQRSSRTGRITLVLPENVADCAFYVVKGRSAVNESF
ncbi:MAG: hypothetical protein MUC87_01735 [Bacteroidia bacterium]|jgi:hypothetical protein|nr:hypothetical protein [Bacteroidia bacterium]